MKEVCGINKGPLALNPWTVFTGMYLVQQNMTAWVWRDISSQIWSAVLTANQSEPKIENNHRFSWGLACFSPSSLRGGFNPGRGLWGYWQSHKSQFNSMSTSASKISGLLNQLHRPEDPVLLVHMVPIVSFWFYPIGKKRCACYSDRNGSILSSRCSAWILKKSSEIRHQLLYQPPLV